MRRCPPRRSCPSGPRTPKPAPGVLDADADAVLLPPSNPVVSVGIVLAVPGIRDAVLSADGPVVGVSPIIAGAPVRGMADACLAAIGVPVTAEGVGRHHGARSDGGLLDAWLVDVGAADAGADVPGVTVAVRPLLMPDVPAATALATATLEVVAALR